MTATPALARLPNHPVVPTPDEVRENFKIRSRPATPEQIDAAVWLATTAQALGLSTFGAIGKFTKSSDSLISRYLRGVYDADLTEITERLGELRANFEKAVDLEEKPLVHNLQVVKKIVVFAGMVRFTRQIGTLWGESQTGKSTGIDIIASDPKVDTVLFRLPASGTQKDSINALAEACGVPTRKDDEEKRDRILRRLKPNTLLIVDEFHQAFVGRKLKMGLIERIREINDLSKCGVLLCGTPIFMDMLEDPKFCDFLSQIRRRGVLRLFIPTAPMSDPRTQKSDVDLICAAYQLPPPPSRVEEGRKESAKTIVSRITTANGIGELTKYFQVARCLAANDRQPLSWSHFLATCDTLSSLSLRA